MGVVEVVQGGVFHVFLSRFLPSFIFFVFWFSNASFLSEASSPPKAFLEGESSAQARLSSQSLEVHGRSAGAVGVEVCCFVLLFVFRCFQSLFRNLFFDWLI